MKKARIIVYLLASAGLISCDGEDKGPTTFRGEVVFPEDYERVADAKVDIVGVKSGGALGHSDDVVDTTVALDQDRRFEVTFPAVDVTYYTLTLLIFDSNGVLEGDLSEGAGELDCPSHNCTRFIPGENYDFTIRVLE